MFSHFHFQSFNSWSKLDCLGISSLKNFCKLHVTWSFKEERDSGNRYYPRTAHWDKFWNRCVSSYIRWSTTGMNIVRRQYSSGVPSSTFPRRIWWFHLRGMEMLINATYMRKFFRKWNDVFFEFNVCSYTNVFLIRLLSEQFLHMRLLHPGVPLKGGHSNIA